MPGDGTIFVMCFKIYKTPIDINALALVTYETNTRVCHNKSTRYFSLSVAFSVCDTDAEEKMLLIL
jgi:hypothetical protein